MRAWGREAERAVGRRGIPMYEPAFELHHTALMRDEKSTELLEHRRECREQPTMIAELIVELVAASEAHRRVKIRAHIARATGERIEQGELRHTEAAGEAGTRQAQHGANGAHARARQTCAGFFGPTQRAERQRCELTGELRRVEDHQRLAGARRSERRERCGGESEYWPDLKWLALASELTPQTRKAPEQVQAPCELEQQAIGWYQTHSRSEALRANGQLFQS